VVALFDFAQVSGPRRSTIVVSRKANNVAMTSATMPADLFDATLACNATFGGFLVGREIGPAGWRRQAKAPSFYGRHREPARKSAFHRIRVRQAPPSLTGAIDGARNFGPLGIPSRMSSSTAASMAKS